MMDLEPHVVFYFILELIVEETWLPSLSAPKLAPCIIVACSSSLD